MKAAWRRRLAEYEDEEEEEEPVSIHASHRILALEEQDTETNVAGAPASSSSEGAVPESAMLAPAPSCVFTWSSIFILYLVLANIQNIQNILKMHAYRGIGGAPGFWQT